MASVRIWRWTVSLRVYRNAPSCEHEWMHLGTPGDLWYLCYLCGTRVNKARDHG